MPVLTAEACRVFESVPDLYLILSPDFHILTASDAYLAATYTQRHEITGRIVFEVFPDNPDLPDVHSVRNLRHSLEKVARTKEPHQMELQRYDVQNPSDGGGFEEKYWNPINCPVLNEGGEMLYIIHKVTDVSEKFRQQQQIRELKNREQSALKQVDWEQRKLRSIFMQAPVGIAIYESRDHIIEFANPSLCETWGRKPADILGKPVFEALPEVKGQGFEPIFDQVFESGQPFEAREIPAVLYPNGKPVESFFRLVFQPLRDPQQKITGILQISIDVTQQVVARRTLEQQERQLRLVTEALPVLIAYVDKEERYRFANKAYESWFPYKAEELLGQKVKDIVGDKAYEGIKDYIIGALKGERQDFEANMPYRDDFVKFIRTTYVPDLQNGEVAGIYILVTDVTEQTLARQQLEESEEKYRSLFETMDQGFCILEMIFDEADEPVDYRFLETNPTFDLHTGLINAKGKTARELVPGLEPHWFEVYGTVAKTGEAARFSQGSEVMGRWFVVNAFRIGGSGSRKVALLFTDVTQQKQVEESLKRSNLWFKRVNEATQDAIWDWDLQTNKINWNQGVYSMFNFGEGEVDLSASWWVENIHPDDRDRIEKGIHEVIDSGREHWSAEYRFLTGNSGFKIVFDRGFVIHDEEGKPVRMIGSMQDITERKKAENNLRLKNEQLIRINNDLDNFIYTASHDLKAPILNIEGLMNLLNRSVHQPSPNSEKVESIMKMIYSSIERFKETIKDLAEVAKVQSNAEEEVMEVSFNELLEEVKFNIQSLIRDSDVLIESDFSQVPSIRFSKKNLRSIIYNLVSNAIKYRSPERRPHVIITTARPDTDHILLSVRDNGSGIKEKDKEKVFMMFKRLNQQVEGTGIGMAIVKKIIDNVGGKIELESEIGKGSNFQIFLKE